MPLTFNPEISAGTIIAILSLVCTIFVTWGSIKQQLTEIFRRVGNIEKKVEQHNATLSQIAVQKNTIEHLEADIRNLRNEFERTMMFRPIIGANKDVREIG